MVPCGPEHESDVLPGIDQWRRQWRGVMVIVGGDIWSKGHKYMAVNFSMFLFHRLINFPWSCKSFSIITTNFICIFICLFCFSTEEWKQTKFFNSNIFQWKIDSRLVAYFLLYVKENVPEKVVGNFYMGRSKSDEWVLILNKLSFLFRSL